MYPIDFFWRAVQRWPQRVAIDTPSEQLSFEQLAQQVCATASGLLALDPRPQSRVPSAPPTVPSISLHSWPCWPAARFGCP